VGFFIYLISKSCKNYGKLIFIKYLCKPIVEI
jgi:hypothetical protein